MAGILKVDRVQSDSNLAFQVGSANVAYVNSTGLNITGGQIIGNGQIYRESNGLLYANNGISFPATQVSSSDPNTLDDYEEGTWTPTIRGAGTAGVYTLGLIYAYYTKIGRMVTVTFTTGPITVVSAGTSYLMISGLPFTKIGNSQFSGSFRATGTGGLDYGGSATGATLEFVTYGASTDLYLRGTGDAYAGVDVPVSGITSGGTDLSGTITYFV